MIPAAHRHVMLVEDRGDIVRMHTLEIEGEDAEPPLTGTDQSETGNARQPVDPVTSQSLLMVEDVVAPELLDEVDRGTQTDRTGDVRRPGFEPVRRFLVLGLLESDVEDHLAAALPRRQRRQQLPAG